MLEEIDYFMENIFENYILNEKFEHFDSEKVGEMKVNNSPIRKLSKFYAKASAGRLNTGK